MIKIPTTHEGKVELYKALAPHMSAAQIESSLKTNGEAQFRDFVADAERGIYSAMQSYSKPIADYYNSINQPVYGEQYKSFYLDNLKKALETEMPGGNFDAMKKRLETLQPYLSQDILDRFDSTLKSYSEFVNVPTKPFSGSSTGLDSQALINEATGVTTNADGTPLTERDPLKVGGESMSPSEIAARGPSNAEIAAGKQGGTTPDYSSAASTTAAQSGQQNLGDAGPMNPSQQTGTPQLNATSNATGALPDNGDTQAALGVLKEYLNNGTIDNATYQMFEQAINLWTPGDQVDYANILNTFNKIKTSDIDPYFQEQVKQFTDSLENNRSVLQQSRALETEQERTNYQRNKEAIQGNLEASGMTFSGQGLKKIGNESAFAQEGTPQAAQSAIPTTRFGGEGELQQANRVATSSSQLRYDQSLRDLQRQAEATLGSAASGGLVPEVQQLGGITGTMVNEKKQAYGSSLVGVYNQQQNNLASQEQQKVFS